MQSFQTISKQIRVNNSKRVKYIELSLEAKDCGSEQGGEANVFFTDVMFQSGTVATSWVGHVSEIRWSFDNA